MKYVAQRESWDCGIAALAMATGESYERVYDDLRASAGPEGINDDLTKDWLFRNDWAWQERTRNVWKGGSYHPHVVWPPRPFANTHICFVEATAGWHYCVLDFEGRVLDPFKQSRQSLADPDYKRVASVLGLFRINQRRDEVSR